MFINIFRCVCVYHFPAVLFFSVCSVSLFPRRVERDSFCSCQPESGFAARGPCWGNLFLSCLSRRGSTVRTALPPALPTAARPPLSRSSCCCSAWPREHKLKYKGLLWPLLADTAMADQTFLRRFHLTFFFSSRISSAFVSVTVFYRWDEQGQQFSHSKCFMYLGDWSSLWGKELAM